MTRRALPLLVDALPLYASPKQILGAITQDRIALPHVERMFLRTDFPLYNYLLGGYYVPAVLAYFENMEARRAPATQGVRSWQETAKRRG